MGELVQGGAIDDHTKLVHEGGVAGGDCVGTLACRHASTWNGCEVLDGTGHDSQLIGPCHDGLREWVLAGALEGGGELHECLFAHDGRAVCAAGGHDVCHGRFARCDGPRLVENHGTHAVQRLECLGALEQDAHLGTAPGSYHDRDGRGEAQGARTADDHDGDGRGECFVHVAARGDEPHDEGDGGNGEHDRHEHAGDLVGQACDGGLGGVGVLDQADDTREVGVGAHACGAEGKGAGAVDGGGAHGIADALLHRHGLAGQRALVHGRGALQYHAVDGDRLARTY